jgi:hypothetical protein
MSQRLPLHVLRMFLQDVIEGFRHQTDGWNSSDVTEYRGTIENYGAVAAQCGYEGPLLLAMDRALTDASIDLGKLASSFGDVEHDEARALLVYAREVLWPDAGPIVKPDVELVEYSQKEWDNWHAARMASRNSDGKR